ncbi:MAG: DNA-binding response regulator [Flavobacteriales bacterium]|nr:DNA-binding response regulator [Flavobacteriales bacterium]|tara:strand:- start:18477 stop:19166 length:690 start_codon:yes stop_codon:yes gene_type:complete
MSKKKNILVVEDEMELAKSILVFLSSNDFTPFHAKNLESAKKLLRSENFTLVLLDLGLPDGDGFSLIKEIKSSKSDIGLIILSAQDSLEKKVKGLELGADDYLTKPFFLPELNARLKSVLRRLNMLEIHELKVNEITLYPEQMRALVHDNELDLTAKEFDLLVYFISNQNRVISKTTLGEYMSSNYTDYGFSDDMLYTHIKNLKKKLASNKCADYIKNIYGVGYKFMVK